MTDHVMFGGSVQRHQRLLSMIVILQARRQVTATELAEQFGVSSRTVLRDIEALADADIPVVTERGRYGGISLLPGAELDLPRLSSTESEVLELFGVDLAKAQQLGVDAAAQSITRKLATRRRWSPPGRESERLPLAHVVSIDNGGWFAPEAGTGVAALVEALRSGQRLRIRYRSSGQDAPRERDVDPYGVFSRGGRWYLIADQSGEPRMFALARLEHWLLLPERRELSADVSVEEIAGRLVARLESAQPVEVEALLDAHTVDIARRILGTRLISVEATDLLAKKRIRVGYRELDGVRQLLQFSDHIEVVHPPEARSLIAELARNIAQVHT